MYANVISPSQSKLQYMDSAPERNTMLLSRSDASALRVCPPVCILPSRFTGPSPQLKLDTSVGLNCTNESTWIGHILISRQANSAKLKHIWASVRLVLSYFLRHWKARSFWYEAVMTGYDRY